MAKGTGTGIQAALWSLMGWHTPAPSNYTRREAQAIQGGMLNPESGFKSLTSNTVDFSQRMREMMNMAKSSLGGTLFQVYAEEATQVDLVKGLSLWFECSDSNIERDLNEMLERIESETYIQALANRLSICGNAPRRIRWNNSDGVLQLLDVPVESWKRIWERDSKKLIGFTLDGEQPDTPIYENYHSVFAPWDFVHWRRILDTDTEYGIGVLDHLYDLHRKIMMAQDQMVLHRLHTMPNRNVVFIDIGEMSFIDGMQQVQQIKTHLRGQMNVGLDQLDYRHNPPSTDSNLYIPVRTNETNTKIEKLEGSDRIPDVHDLEQLKSDFFGGARIPKEYVGHGESSSLAKASLVTQDIRFARMIRTLRRPIIAGFLQLARLHLSFKGIDPKHYQIHCRMSKVSSIEDEVDAAGMEKRASVAASIAQLCQNLGIPNPEIIELVFSDYLRLNRKFIDVAKLSARVVGALGLKQDGDGGDVLGLGGMGGMGGGPSMGGDLGAMDDTDDMDMGDGMGEEPPPPGGDSEPLNASYENRNSSILVERQIDRIRKTIKYKLEEDIGGTKVLTTVQEAVKTVKFSIQSQMRDLSRIEATGKISLTESDEVRQYWDNSRDPIYPLPETKVKKTLTEDDRRNLVRMAITETFVPLSESLDHGKFAGTNSTGDELKQPETAQGDSTNVLHEAVKIRNNLRREKKKVRKRSVTEIKS